MRTTSDSERRWRLRAAAVARVSATVAGVAHGTAVQAPAGGGGTNRAMEAEAAVAQGTGNGARRLGSGSVRARHREGLVSAVAGAGSGGANKSGCAGLGF